MAHEATPAGSISADLWHSVDYVVIDVEGNGGQPPELVELAIVSIVAGRIGKAQSWLVRPRSEITWHARQVHGISNADVAAMPTFQAVEGDVRAALAECIPVGHNVGTDIAVLGRTLTGWRPREAIDTLRLARTTWTLPSYQLSALAESRNLARDLPADQVVPHRAAYDALVTACLFIDLAGGGPVPMTLTALRDSAGLDLESVARTRSDPQLPLFD